MAGRRKSSGAARFIEGAATLGALGGVLEALTLHPLTVCKSAATSSQAANSEFKNCINRSITAIVVHYGVPIAVGFVAGGAMAIALVLSFRAMRARA